MANGKHVSSASLLFFPPCLCVSSANARVVQSSSCVVSLACLWRGSYQTPLKLTSSLSVMAIPSEGRAGIPDGKIALHSVDASVMINPP